MSLSHAGPLNNAQRSSQNKPLPRLLAPPHLSPLSGASPTRATRTEKKKYNTATPSPASPSPHPYLCAECSWMCRGKPLIEATSQTFACVCDIFSPLPSRLPSSPPSVLSPILRFLEFTGHALDSRHSECRGYLARGPRPVRLIRDVDGRRRLIRLLLSVM